MLPGLTDRQPFYSFVREELLFCATLGHLLMQKGPNLGRFLNLVSSRLPGSPGVPTTRLEEAEIYLEFTFLRDSWKSLGKDNEKSDGASLNCSQGCLGLVTTREKISRAPSPSSMRISWGLGERR